MDIANEKWKPIPGYENYEASNLGRVRSKNRTFHVNIHPVCGPHIREYRAKILSPKPSSTGYSRYALADGKFISGQRAVFSAFNGKIKTGYVINHINHNRLDNRIENLECITHSQNSIHAYSHGRRKNPHTKSALLSNEDVKSIRFFYQSGHGSGEVQRILEKIYKVKTKTLRRVASKENYCWVK